ncbi:NUDIX domain-containing protein [Micromonospora sp. DR5-3]|uniref:NUDIX hydrolase n=1 Tax=unclassified Micromonospora TaxID=2617518 RepID=UPI0011D97081|nr:MULTISPECIES: NUDIX domain-containing protein [unclassified Micromonospora]MCW3820002.1 NUDIX domain-containing protein [Micromonospora sp. DR5-3]TYC20251.1 NUDIX domain-containing protein [Micromonospora sp. MP36]
MPVSPYVARLRQHIGHDLLMLYGVSAVVTDDAGRLLLARRGDNGRWSLPAGMVDPGEQPADALLREVYEETGVRVAIERIGGVATHPVRYPNGDTCEYLNVWFRCRAAGGVATADGDESVAVGWFAPDDLPELDGWSRLRIDTALADPARAWYAAPGERHPALNRPDNL